MHMRYNLRMPAGANAALYQRFLPDHHQRAYVWKYAQSVGGRRPRHFHGEPELNLVVSGSVRFGVGDGVVNVSRGELLVFPSGQDHVVLDASPDLYLYAVGLDAAYSDLVLGRESVAPLHVRLSENELDGVVNRAAAIVDRSEVEELGAELWERIFWLGRRAVARSSPGPHVLTRRALKLVSTAPELGLDALAAELRTHPSEVSRHFHRDLGMTLVRYRARLKLLHFIGLLESGKHDLMRAASESGFGSYSQCHRAFRAEFGCAPRAFFFSDLGERMQLTYADQDG
jgi:AraC-like DNA-binding protein/mannose-6-phosphate isomerase-like protein (cupin superfamily)